MTIKNGDTPAMPITYEQAIEARMWGRTKREMMAMHIMTGLCSKYGVAFETDTVQDAIRMADSLLAALDRTNDN